MQVSQYGSTCLDEASAIMAREWSRHSIESQGPGLDMRLRLRPISREMSLSSLAYGTEIRVVPGERDNVILVQMPRRGTACAFFADRSVALYPGTAAIIDVKRLCHAVFSADYEMLALRVSLPRLERQAEALLGRHLRRSLRFHTAIAHEGTEWWNWQPVAAALSAMDANPNPEMPRAVLAPFEETVLTSLLLCHPNSCSEDLSRPAPAAAPRHVVRAEQFIRAHVHTALTTGMVAMHVDVSIRALFDGFKVFRGMSPAQYIRDIRLERARDDLVMGEASVADTAAKWGFTHAANFATRYRQRFGEAPGATRRFGRVGSRQG